MSELALLKYRRAIISLWADDERRRVYLAGLAAREEQLALEAVQVKAVAEMPGWNPRADHGQNDRRSPRLSGRDAHSRRR